MNATVSFSPPREFTFKIENAFRAPEPGGETARPHFQPGRSRDAIATRRAAGPLARRWAVARISIIPYHLD